jgi:Alpha/beta hydrolase family
MRHSLLHRLGTAVAACLAILLFASQFVEAGPGEDAVVALLQSDKPYHTVPPDLFAQLGWDLPDGGASVKALADAAPGGAFDPRKLEAIPAEKLGYRAKWHEVRYKVYGLDWDIPGLQLTPNNPLPGLPTMVIINGGAANWYEFFVDPLNRPGLGQYLAQKIPVLLVTIPGNYRHGGWTEKAYEKRIPGYLLDRDVGPDELKIRNAVYTFRVVADGVKKLIETVTTGPVVIIGHSTGGEIQYMLKDTDIRKRLQGLSMGWGTGGPAGLETMRAFRGERTADNYRDVWTIKERPPSDYARGYLGPLNPVWDPNLERQDVAEKWIGLEERRRPQFKQPLQDMEHNSADNLREHAATQIRQTLAGNKLGVNPDEVVADLFSTMRANPTGYRKMIWTTTQLDDGHWNPDPSKARELQVANAFRELNPNIPIRVLVFDVPMTHYGHVEKPRQLAGGLVAALTWLAKP